MALFEALYGARPYRGTAATEARIVFPKGLPKSVVRVLERGLRSDTADRFLSMRELILQLRSAVRAPARVLA